MNKYTGKTVYIATETRSVIYGYKGAKTAELEDTFTGCWDTQESAQRNLVNRYNLAVKEAEGYTKKIISDEHNDWSFTVKARIKNEPYQHKNRLVIIHCELHTLMK